MNKEEKLAMLQSLSEEELTKRFLIPLYESMDCKNVRYTHRKLEFGKDIIYYKDDEYGNRIYTGVQVKRTKITTSDVDKLSRQTSEAFGEPFTDLSTGKKLDLDQFVVLTSNEILEEAKDSLWASLRGARLDKLVKVIDGHQLVTLLEQHLPSAFWDEYDYFSKYFNAMKTDFETIKDITAIGQNEPVPLEKIFVSLRVVEHGRYRDVQHSFLKSMSDKFAEKPESTNTEFYVYGGIAQNGKSRKSEFIEAAKKIVEGRVSGTPAYNPDVGMPQGQRFLMPYVMNHTDIMAYPENLVIVGVPGSGKTTLLKHLALKTCKENLEKQERICVPLPITLRELSESENDLRRYIDAVFEKYQFPEAKEFVEADLKSGKCVLLLDGFDELATEKQQEKIALAIREFIEKYPQCQIIVTSRIAGYHEELSGFTKLELLEFDDKQIEQFIQNWFSKTNPEKAQSMYRAIKENEQIKKLARNPLMIAIIAIIYEEDKELPQKRAKLYERCVDVLLSKWDVQKKLKNKYPAEQKEFILRKLAFYAHSTNKRVLTEEELIQEMLRYFSQIRLTKDDAKPFLDEIWQRSYLLRQIARDRYDFLHLSFQEYFTAQELKEQEDGIAAIVQHVGEPWWEEPILLYAGIIREASTLTTLIRSIQKQVPEDIFYSNLMLFGKCIADAEFVESSLREEIVNELWSLYQTAEFDSLKGKAMGVLARIKPDSLIDSLITDLESKDSSVRGSAAEALGTIGSERAVDPLIKSLTEDKLREVRKTVAEALGLIKSERAVDPLLKALTEEEAVDVRWSVAEALGKIRSERVVEPLLESLITAQVSEGRWSVAHALGLLGSEKAVEPLINALTANEGVDVRWSAAYALAMLGSERAVEPLLEALTTAQESVLQWRAADALGWLGSERAVEPLLEALTTTHELRLQLEIGMALGNIGGEKAVEPLIKVLTTNEEVGAQWSAAHALGMLGSKRTFESLLETLTTAQESILREYAAYALGKLGSEKAVEPLIKTLTTDKDSSVRGSTADALGEMGDKRAIEPLKEALQDEGEFTGGKVKDSAFTALEHISRRIQERITR